MTIRSAIPTVTNAALSMLTTQLAKAGQGGQPLEVFDGEPSSNVPDEFVLLSSAFNGRQSWGAIGTQRRNETFDLNGMIRVWAGGDSQAPLRQRCFDLLALVETAVDNDPFLSGSVNGTVQFTANDASWGALDTGRYCEVTFTLSVVTQLIAI